MDVLEGSGCAARLVTLRFAGCKIGGEGMRTLVDLLCKDAFSASKKLCVPRNPDITDVGVVALADALGQATQTCSTHLDLESVNMGDEGIAALASLVSEGRLEQLQVVHLSCNDGVSDRGIITLAQAIGMRKLAMLKDFRMEGLKENKVTRLGVSAIALAIISGSSHLKAIYLSSSGPGNDTYINVVRAVLSANLREADVAC